MAVREPNVRLQRACAVPPEAVYDVLSELGSHRVWAGERQRRSFRLLSLEAPDGPAAVGMIFTSTGAIPMSGRRWNDRSTVTAAARPTTFEFVTDARAEKGRRVMRARYVHRYEIASRGNGSVVTYTLTEEQLADPMLRFGIPGVRAMTWSMAAFMLARGLGNLLHEATRRQALRSRRDITASASAR
jgi:hypothetical protein